MKTLKVYLNVYDFTPVNGIRCVSYRCLNQVYENLKYSNKEYCFAVISTDSNESGVIVIDPESAEYTFNRKIYLG